jgi:hypothetical protein
MEFWSKGLGRRSLVLDLGRERVEADVDQVALTGNVSAPVTWNYIMYVDARDWTELFDLALRREMASYLLARTRLGALARLTAFLFKFLALYLGALARVWLRLAPEPSGVTVAPDLRARADIDPAALAAMGDRPAGSMRRPRPRRSPGVSAGEAGGGAAGPPREGG